jgi:chemotaxis protein MotB
LQKEIVSLKSRLDEISKKLTSAKEKAKKKFKISQLVDLLGQKDKEIDRLRKLARYRSEFLAKLEKVFEGVPDIKVQGDRFVFQSEILFASGRANINETGKKELDKFAQIYKEMVPKIPKDLDIVILIQGYTDDVPIRSGRYRSNWELAAARALEVVRYLVQRGIPPTRVAAASFGEFHPVDHATTPEARRLNRRIEIKITTL